MIFQIFNVMNITLKPFSRILGTPQNGGQLADFIDVIKPEFCGYTLKRSDEKVK